MKAILQSSPYKQLLPWVLPVLVIMIWQVLGQYGIIASRVLPTPLAVLKAAVLMTQKGTLFEYIGTSTERAFIGFLIGGSIGFAFGILNGMLPVFEKLTDTSIQMIRNIPHLAMIPLVILWFGIGEEAKLFLVALGAYCNRIYQNGQTINKMNSFSRQVHG